MGASRVVRNVLRTSVTSGRVIDVDYGPGTRSIIHIRFHFTTHNLHCWSWGRLMKKTGPFQEKKKGCGKVNAQWGRGLWLTFRNTRWMTRERRLSTYLGQADLHEMRQAQSKQGVIETKKNKFDGRALNVHWSQRLHATQATPTRGSKGCSNTSRPGVSSWHQLEKIASCTSRTGVPVGSPNACSRNGGYDRTGGRM